MVSTAIKWLNTSTTIWANLAYGATLLVMVTLAYSKIDARQTAASVDRDAIKAASAVAKDAMEGRIDNLEKDRDQTYGEIVKLLETLRIAREKVHETEKKNTDEYRKEMRERMRVSESTTNTIQAILERLEKRVP